MNGAAYSIELLTLLGAGLLFTGAIAGVLAGLLGVGGGIVIVPVLFLLFQWLGLPEDILMHLAVGTSLATIIPTSISSARSHYKRGAIDMALLRSWAPFVFIGALIGGLASKVIESSSLTLVFGVIAFLVSINMALPKQIVIAQEPPKSVLGRSVLPTIIGFLSALMGIGGGTLSVPILSAFSFPVRAAVATASAFGLAIAVPAASGFVWSGWAETGLPPYSLGYVSIPAAVLIFSTSVLTAPLGSRLAHTIQPRSLRIAFAIFLGITSIKMLYSVLG